MSPFLPGTESARQQLQTKEGATKQNTNDKRKAEGHGRFAKAKKSPFPIRPNARLRDRLRILRRSRSLVAEHPNIGLGRIHTVFVAGIKVTDSRPVGEHDRNTELLQVWPATGAPPASRRCAFPLRRGLGTAQNKGKALEKATADYSIEHENTDKFALNMRKASRYSASVFEVLVTLLDDIGTTLFGLLECDKPQQVAHRVWNRPKATPKM